MLRSRNGARIAAVLLAGCAAVDPSPRLDWEVVPSDAIAAGLRGVAATPTTVWVSGGDGTLARSRDGGRTWSRRAPPGADGRELRDVHADGGGLLVMAAGAGNATAPTPHIWRSEDDGDSWRAVWSDARPQVFLDAIAVASDGSGLAFGDPIDGRFLLLRTGDGGRTWHPRTAAVPPLAGEAGFAASGTCVAAAPGGRAWVVTGGGDGVRVLRTVDGGETWSVATTTLPGGAASRGGFSITSAGARLVAVGGDYREQQRAGTATLSDDGGVTWRAPSGRSPAGYRSCVAGVPTRPRWLIAVGEGGCDLSVDGGDHWTAVPDAPAGMHALHFLDAHTAWAVGRNGLRVRLTVTQP